MIDLNLSISRFCCCFVCALAIVTMPVGAVEKKWDGGTSGTGSSWTASSGVNWNPDGVPTADDDVVFDNTFVLSLPATITIPGTTATIRTFTWNANSSSQLRNSTSTVVNSSIVLLGDGAGSPVISMGPSAVSSTFTFERENSSTGTGTLGVRLGLSAATINVANAGATLDINTILSENPGVGARVIKTGQGLLDLSGFSNSYTGGLQINAGTVNVTGAGNLGMTPSAADAVGLNGGALRISGLFTSTLTGRGFTFGAGGAIIDVASGGAGTISGAMTGPGRLTKAGPGTLWLTSGSSDYEGGLHILGGTVRIGNAGQLGALPGSFVPNHLQIDGGTLLMQSSSVLGSNRGVTIDSGGATIVVDDGFSPSFNGIITGVGGLTKRGAGVLALNGNNLYFGQTVVAEGTLLFNGTQGGGMGYTVQSGATLGGTGTSGRDLVVEDGGTVAPGQSIGTLAMSSANFHPASQFLVEIKFDDPTPSTADQLKVLDSVTLGDGVSFPTLSFAVTVANYSGAPESFVLIDNQGFAPTVGQFAGKPDGIEIIEGLLKYTVHYNDSSFGGDGNDVVVVFTAVPEPSSGLVAALAAGALLRRRTR